MPTFERGFLALAVQLGGAAGEPMEAERYITPDLCIQTTSTGLMVYSAVANRAMFLPAMLPSEPEPAPIAKPFRVWNGTQIASRYHSVADVAEAVRALIPAGSWAPEWLVKAGEGGTWQARWDRHRLAVSGPEKLRELVQAGQDCGLAVTPYVVVRGRAEWREAEIEQIAQCAAAAGRVVLNLEDGLAYWNGPTDTVALRELYLLPMLRRVQELAAGATVQLTVIPRAWVLDALGGPDAIREWLRFCNGCSWECYGMAARDLLVDAAVPRVRALFPDWPDCYFVPLVQRGELARWAGTEWAAAGIEVWHLDGDV